jgi:hypothetical protein
LLLQRGDLAVEQVVGPTAIQPLHLSAAQRRPVEEGRGDEGVNGLTR